MRLNYEQVIDFYNDTVTSPDITKTQSVNWRKAEFSIKWEDKEIVYCFKPNECKEVGFYDEDIKEINGIMIYNLQPNTVSFIKNLTLSSKLPSDWNSSKKNSITILFLILITLIFS